jgi:hypothetical protein
MKHRTQLLFAGVILVFSVISAKAQQAPITCNGLLSEEQVRQLLTAGVADVRVREFVSKCGVDFPPTPTTENRLRKAGASDSLIKLARERSAAEQQRKEQEAERLRQAAIEEQKKEQEAERRRQAAIEEQKKEQEAERLRQAAIEEQKHLEAARVAELRQKIGLGALAVQPLKPDLALNEARKQLVSLRAQTHDIGVRLKAQYPSLDVSPNVTKGAFETTAEFQVRVDQANAEHAKMLERYSADLAILTGDYNKQIDELLSRKYAKAGMKIALTSYDADRQQLVAKVGDYSYRFTLEPVRARDWYDHEGDLMVKGNFLKAEDYKLPAANEISLTGPQGQIDLNSTGWDQETSGTWKGILDDIVIVNGGAGLQQSPVGNGEQILTIDLHLEGNKLTGTIQSSFYINQISDISNPPRADSKYKYSISGTCNFDEVSFTFKSRLEGWEWDYEGHVVGDEVQFARTFIHYKQVLYRDQITLKRER